MKPECQTKNYQRCFPISYFQFVNGSVYLTNGWWLEHNNDLASARVQKGDNGASITDLSLFWAHVDGWMTRSPCSALYDGHTSISRSSSIDLFCFLNIYVWSGYLFGLLINPYTVPDPNVLFSPFFQSMCSMFPWQ